MRRLMPFIVLLSACGTADVVTEDVAELDTEDGVEALTVNGDVADTGCTVILREVKRSKLADGRYASTCANGRCYWAFEAKVDVALSAISSTTSTRILYMSSAVPGKWLDVRGAKASGAPAGFQRYGFKFYKGTQEDGVSATGIMRTTLDVAPYLKTSTGRLFDHNVNANPFTNYRVDSASGFALATDPARCAPPAPYQPVAKTGVSFTGDFKTVQQGAVVAGGELRIDYDLARLPACRGTHNGFAVWDTRAFVKFYPGGEAVDGTLKGYANPSSIPGPVVAQPFTVQVPKTARSMEVYFKNSADYDGQSCATWDSNYGQNYKLDVVAQPAAVAWAGNFGGVLTRACTHADGLAEPLTLDGYLRERACIMVDAEVYAAGVTDVGANPGYVMARVEYSVDGKPAKTAPLSYQGRVGNNLRFRWEDLRSVVSYEYWNKVSYSFQFSTDGLRWFAMGVDGGFNPVKPRTLVRDATFCNPGWPGCP